MLSCKHHLLKDNSLNSLLSNNTCVLPTHAVSNLSPTLVSMVKYVH